jgi:hypothetical protein
MSKRLEAVARAVRSLFQGALAAGAIAAVTAVQTVMGDGSFQLRVVVVAAVSAFVTAAVSYVFTVVAPYAGSSSPAVEAFVRGLRTLIAGAVSTGIIAGGDAAVTAIRGGEYAPWVLASAAVAAGATAVVAFVHNALRPRVAAA